MFFLSYLLSLLSEAVPCLELVFAELGQAHYKQNLLLLLNAVYSYNITEYCHYIKTTTKEGVAGGVKGEETAEQFQKVTTLNWTMLIRPFTSE